MEELQEKNASLVREQEIMTSRTQKVEHEYRSHGSKPPLRKSNVNKEFITIFKPMSEKEQHDTKRELEV